MKLLYEVLHSIWKMENQQSTITGNMNPFRFLISFCPLHVAVTSARSRRIPARKLHTTSTKQRQRHSCSCQASIPSDILRLSLPLWDQQSHASSGPRRWCISFQQGHVWRTRQDRPHQAKPDQCQGEARGMHMREKDMQTRSWITVYIEQACSP